MKIQTHFTEGFVQNIDVDQNINADRDMNVLMCRVDSHCVQVGDETVASHVSIKI